MGVLVSRFAGANQPDKVNRVVYQAFLTAVFMAIILADHRLLRVAGAAASRQRGARGAGEALPFLRMMFMGILGMMMFFMLSGAFRAAGDAQTPLRLGVGMTVLTISSTSS
jgi:Na+-driven multidrug efflux pump